MDISNKTIGEICSFMFAIVRHLPQKKTDMFVFIPQTGSWAWARSPPMGPGPGPRPM